jgi:hypothetical protein
MADGADGLARRPEGGDGSFCRFISDEVKHQTVSARHEDAIEVDRIELG